MVDFLPGLTPDQSKGPTDVQNAPFLAQNVRQSALFDRIWPKSPGFAQIWPEPPPEEGFWARILPLVGVGPYQTPKNVPFWDFWRGFWSIFGQILAKNGSGPGQVQDLTRSGDRLRGYSAPSGNQFGDRSPNWRLWELLEEVPQRYLLQERAKNGSFLTGWVKNGNFGPLQGTFWEEPSRRPSKGLLKGSIWSNWLPEGELKGPGQVKARFWENRTKIGSILSSILG